MRYAWEITQYEPPTAFALRSISGPIPATIRVLLESLDGARTKVILVAEVRLGTEHTSQSRFRYLYHSDLSLVSRTRRSFTPAQGKEQCEPYGHHPNSQGFTLLGAEI
jgi:hypothetical protein